MEGRSSPASAADEGALAVRKFEEEAGEPVGSEIRIDFDHGNRPARLILEDEARHRDQIHAEVEKAARLLGNSIAGLAESGARLLLSGEDDWTPETLGRELGRLAARAQAAV